jgi:hypothetical protein
MANNIILYYPKKFSNLFFELEQKYNEQLISYPSNINDITMTMAGIYYSSPCHNYKVC